jgi:hypothetical protein
MPDRTTPALTAAVAAVLLAACAAPSEPKPAAGAAPPVDPRCAYLNEMDARMDGRVPPPPAASAPGSVAVTGTASARNCRR